MLFMTTPQATGQKEHPVKFTALLYLEEALLLEYYEDCADMIQIAKEFGAKDAEIQEILLAYSAYQAKVKPIILKKENLEEPEEKFVRRFK